MSLRLTIIIRISVVYQTKFSYIKLLLSFWVNRTNRLKLEQKFKHEIFQLFFLLTDLTMS